MPDNAFYAHTAYAAAAVIYGVYALSLWRRRRQLQRRWEAAARTVDHGVDRASGEGSGDVGGVGQ
jgi:HAMP domain-containing protein